VRPHYAFVVQKSLAPAERATGGGVRSLLRGMAVLRAVAGSPHGVSQSDVGAVAHLPLPTVHRLVVTLERAGFLRREPGSRLLRPGLELVALAGPVLASLGLPGTARAVVDALATQTGETANLATLLGAEVLYLHGRSGARLLSVQTPLGLRLPAHCTSLGKCLLAHIGNEAARAVLGAEPYARLTRHTRTTWRGLRADLARTRRGGLAVSEEEYEVGLVSLAVAAGTLPDGRPLALNVSLPAARAGTGSRETIAGSLRRAAAALAGPV